MEIRKKLLLAKIGIYLMLVICSFLTCVFAGVNISNFNGHCLLYAHGTWIKETTKSQLAQIDWGPDSACNFTIFIGVLSLVLSTFYLVWLTLTITNIRGLDRTWMEEFVALIMNTIMCICFFSTALTVSVGFSVWCKLIMDPRSGIATCEDGQNFQFNSTVIIDQQHYYTQWTVTQFGAWLCWIIWLMLAIVAIIEMYNRYRHEAFMISVNSERQRLLAQV